MVDGDAEEADDDAVSIATLDDDDDYESDYDQEEEMGGGDGAPPSEAALIARMVSLDTMESIEGCSMSASGLDVSADGPHAAGAIAPM